MATRTDPLASGWLDHSTHAQLIQGAKAAGSAEQARLYLVAAHVVGQLHIKPHLQTHAHMLKLALRTRDWLESIQKIL